ncbi:DUF3883 domain-containing protein [Paenibacillus sp.]|uniref:DUF3883 domain-containing protein n=1 Tax=Paenibacillus sp. TaxID=58172 RepID=UPI0035691181
MSEVRVFDIEAGLPLYLIDDKTTVLVKEGTDIQIGSFGTDLGERQKEMEQQSIHLDVADENDPIPEWVKVNSAIGQFGELLAIEHLKVEHQNNVKLVSDDAKKGYDVEVKIDGEIHAYEVKTTKQNNNKFFITQNELKAANKKRDSFHIIFIKISDDEHSISGYIIDNPIETLEIDYESITQMTRLANIDIKADRFIVNISENYIISQQVILFNSYISKVCEILKFKGIASL